MLSAVGKVFFEVVTTELPIYVNYRDVDSDKLMGQIRFKEDLKYSKDDSNCVKGDIRMEFNCRYLPWIDPETSAGNERLEEVVIGAFIWMSMDNNNLLPEGALPYMVVHDYNENSRLANLVNARLRSLLPQYGCKEVSKNIFKFSPNSGNKMLSDFLKSKQQS